MIPWYNEHDINVRRTGGHEQERNCHMDLYTLTKQLAAIPGPSGREQPVATTILKMIRPYVDNAYIDRVGNVIAEKKGCGEHKKTLCFSAHMDEVAVIVTNIEGSGNLRVTNIGGPNGVSLAYAEVVSLSGVRGRLIPLSDGAPNLGNMLLDIGAKSAEEASELVEVGDFFTMTSTMCRLAGTRFCGHPIDNRVGCAVELEAASRLAGVTPYNDVVFAFSVQEEIALPSLGGSVISDDVKPDIAIAVDVCAAGDAVGGQPIPSKLGGGAALIVRDSTIITDGPLLDEMTAAAKENDIPCQKVVPLNGGTDGVPMQKVGHGSRTGVLSIPMRYLHTAAETADLADVEACVALSVALCSRELA